jgi:hypothetical protein
VSTSDQMMRRSEHGGGAHICAMGHHGPIGDVHVVGGLGISAHTCTRDVYFSLWDLHVPSFTILRPVRSVLTILSTLQ